MPRSVRAIEPREAVGRCKGPSRGGQPGGVGPARGSSVPISKRKINNVRVRITLVLGLESLLGVGPVIAKRIIGGRPYRRVEDLRRVKGMDGSRLDPTNPQRTLRRNRATSPSTDPDSGVHGDHNSSND